VDNRSALVDRSRELADATERNPTQWDASDSTAVLRSSRGPLGHSDSRAQHGITEAEIIRGYGLNPSSSSLIRGDDVRPSLHTGDSPRRAPAIAGRRATGVTPGAEVRRPALELLVDGQRVSIRSRLAAAYVVSIIELAAELEAEEPG
jgi:hypothetical protein